MALLPGLAVGQQPPGPQTSAPPVEAPQQETDAPRPSRRITLPSGTRFAVVLQNGISTRTAKVGDSVYFQTAFPVTQDDQIVIPVGSYIRGSLVSTKRPGRVKGVGEFRMRLDTLILPNGYTVNLNASPGSADSGGREKVDPEGKIQGPSNKGGDVRTIASTTATGAVIGAIAGRGKGAGIGAGVGGLAGLGAVLLTRGPDAELPRGTTLDIVLERGLTLDASKAQFNSLGQMSPVSPAPPRQPPQH
jgi:type IV secretion system protein VirB10